MTNPFESEDREYCVLVNEENQHSLWPVTLNVPAGWSVVGPRGPRKLCLDWIDENWTDLRPKSLIASMAADKEAEYSKGS
jgi:MbtH protein